MELRSVRTLSDGYYEAGSETYYVLKKATVEIGNLWLLLPRMILKDGNQLAMSANVRKRQTM